MYDLDLERGKIREFATAVQSTDPAYFSAHPIVPPTFLVTAMLTWEPADEPGFTDLGFDLKRVLHAEEEYVFHGPPPASGQTLTVSSRLGARYEKQGSRGVMRFGAVVHEFRDPDGNLVAEQTSLFVETAAAPEAP